MYFIFPHYHHKETILSLWITNPLCQCLWVKTIPFEKICISFSRFVPTIANWPSEQIDKLLWIHQMDLDLNTFWARKNTLKVNWALHNWQIAERLGGKVSWLAHLDRWGAKHRSSDFFSSSKGWDELKVNRFYKTQSQFRHIMSDQHGSYETARILAQAKSAIQRQYLPSQKLETK